MPGMAIAARAGLVRMMENRLVVLPHGVRALDRLRTSVRLAVSSEAQTVGLPAGRPDEDWLDLIRDETQSYRQLPCHLCCDRNILHDPPPFAGERPALQWAFGVADTEGMEAAAERFRNGLATWLDAMAVPAAASAEEGRARSWIQFLPQGLDRFLRCPACGYLASWEGARFRRSESTESEQQDLRMVETPGANTIQALASFLDIEHGQTLKAMFYVTTDNELVFAVVRGDRDVSLQKLAALVGRRIAGKAEESVVRGSGAEPGFASPVGLKVRSPVSSEGVLVLGDLSLLEGRNFVAGANRPGHHLLGVNYPRDFRVTVLADIANARRADPCPTCGQPMVEEHGMVLAQWSTHVNAFEYSSASGGVSPGLVGIGTVFLDSVLAALLITHHDERGIAWPVGLAPYQVHVVSLGPKEIAEPLVTRLMEAGLTVLWDDREASPGVKFADADLIGCPVRVTMSRRSMEKGGAEVSRRGGVDLRIVPVDLVAEAAKSFP